MKGYKKRFNNRTLAEEYNRVTGHGTLYPMIFDTASRCEITDIEGNNYTDFSSGYGVINIGWQRKELIKVIQTQAEKSCFSIPWMGNPEATRLAEKLQYKNRSSFHCSRPVRCIGSSDDRE